MMSVDSFFSPVAGHFPDKALGPEFTVEHRAEACTAVFDIQTLATLSAKTGPVFLTDGKGFTIRMISTLHLFLLSQNNRGLASTGGNPLFTQRPPNGRQGS
ncbi:MAG: hypothetical protein JXL20_02840 [Deltaproteobacteria bacterium]|nr:hypothetical protein [Deltaproteobacteria bacterium]